MLVILHLTWMAERGPDLAEPLVVLSQPLPDEPDFLLHRPLPGLTEAMTPCVHLGKALKGPTSPP